MLLVLTTLNKFGGAAILMVCSGMRIHVWLTTLLIGLHNVFD